MSEKIRALVDSGAQINLITRSCAQRLNLNIDYGASSICGIGGSQKTYGIVKLNLCTKTGGNLYLQAIFYVVSKILNSLPSTVVENSAKGTIAKSALADSSYCIPAPIDVVLGVNICAKIFNQKLENGSMVLSCFTPS